MLGPLFTQEIGELDEGMVEEDASSLRIRFQLILTVIGGSDCRRPIHVQDCYRRLLTERKMDC